MKARVPEAGVKSDKKSTAIALFDYGYLVESYKQAGDGSQGVKLAGGIDGYGMIVKAIALGGGDPSMEFAAALAREDRFRRSYCAPSKSGGRRTRRFIARAEPALAFQQYGQDDWRASGKRREELEDRGQKAKNPPNGSWGMVQVQPTKDAGALLSWFISLTSRREVREMNQDAGAPLRV